MPKIDLLRTYITMADFGLPGPKDFKQHIHIIISELIAEVLVFANYSIVFIISSQYFG